jgi:uncharacterized protein
LQKQHCGSIIARMFIRFIQNSVVEALSRSPAVVLLGPRQIGKTTLAYSLKGDQGIYLDLESDEDRSRLANTEQYLRGVQGRLVILDEVQRLPLLFQPLRGLIDEARRNGYKSGQYLLLGSASLDLIQQTSETLAGRISFMELSGLHRLEVPKVQWTDLWVRGGFPESFTADSDATSALWRRDFIRTYLERDVAQFSPRIAAEKLRRLWIMLAHLQGSTINASQLAGNLEIDARTLASYLDLLVDLFLVRRLQPWFNNVGKRLVKSPKIYIRDSGLLHSLLGIADWDALLAHPVLGASWEGHVIESVLAVLPSDASASYYRTAAGAEIDLLLTMADGSQTVIEIKRSTTPKLERGFFSACDDLKPARKWLIYGGVETYPFNQDVTAMSLDEAMRRLVANEHL